MFYPTSGWILWNLLGSSESNFLCCSAGVPGSKPYWQLRVFHACIFLCQQRCRCLFLGWIGVIPIPIVCPLLSIPLLGKVRSLSYLCGFHASLSTTDPERFLFGSLAVGSQFFPLSQALLFCCRFKHKWLILLHSLHF